MDNTIEKRSWWQRNWKWALPTGGCLTIIIIAVSFIGYGVYKVADKLGDETSVFAFINVITKVQKNPEVIAALGRPINIEDNDYDPEMNTNQMNLEMDLRGKKANGVLRVNALKVNDEWDYKVFTVTVEDSGEVIDLLDDIE
ncbi:cytochrome c oxidase assembly factor Coa1 family protein [Dokdonia sinensis]|nr:cytochrome c oxidase assembly factor Coa1 family protein [Dokdonia sinensis]